MTVRPPSSGAPRSPRRRRVVFGAVSAAVALGACGGGSGGATQAGQRPPPGQAAPPVQFALDGAAIVKVRSAGAAWVALAEVQQRVLSRPERRLLFSRPAGEPVVHTPPPGWSLIDFTPHPSGQVTALLGTDREVRLLRFDAAGTVLRDQPFHDPLVRDDPFMDDPIYIRDRDSMLAYVTRDCARLAALDEDAILALRTGQNAVLAYRFAYGADGFARRWRTLVEPGVQVGVLGIIGGAFDPFQSLSNPAHVRLDVSPEGRIAVVVQSDRTTLIEGHAAYFHETPPADLAYGLFVTELDGAGTRLGTRIVPMAVRPEVHAVRWLGATLAVAGRQRTATPPDGSGWDGYVALLRDGQPARVAVIDVDRCDIVFDVLPLPDGRVLAAGATAHTQNPAGASISETGEPLLALLDGDGRLRQRLPFAAGPRQNQIRSLAPWPDGWLAGGLANGPGTHSGDADPALLRADGYVRSGKP